MENTRSTLNRMALSAPTEFEEQIELTYTIGEESNGDWVYEKHDTVPTEYLAYRVFRPTAHYYQREPIRLDGKDFTFASMNASTTLEVIPLVEDPGLLRALVVFYPGLTRPFSWFARYRMSGLWDPLREARRDTLRYAVAQRVQDPTSTAITRLTVTFVFPPGARQPSVQQRALTPTKPKKDTFAGLTRFTYTYDRPTPGMYEWDLVYRDGLG